MHPQPINCTSSCIQKEQFRAYQGGLRFQVTLNLFRVMGQGERSRGSRSKVKWIKPGLKVMMLAGGLTSMLSCFIDILMRVCATRSP